ncbi:MAG: MnhB domain-containing protein, partial [Dehalococcoidia bacterium]
MTEQHDSIILHFVVRAFMVPFIFVFGIYVLVHGEASPGGGFQAGAIVAAAVILGRLTLGHEQHLARFPTQYLIWLASIGMGIYVLAGVVPLFFGANYLDYGELPLQWFNGV